MVVTAEFHHKMQYKFIISMSKVLYCLTEVIRLLKHPKFSTAEVKGMGILNEPGVSPCCG